MTCEKKRGAILGAFVGDALGAVVEFLKPMPLPKEFVDEALEMNGGGFMDLEPGQCTDDSELMICLITALKNNEDPLPYYKAWLLTNPIDVGITCKYAFHNESGTGNNLPELNKESQSNGALMRILPIAIWFYDKDDNYIAERAREDALLSHPHAICQECNAAYCVTIASLLRGNNVHEAILAAKNILQNISTNESNIVLDWIDEGIDILPVPRDKIGWVKWAFRLAFGLLIKETPFREAMVYVLSCGGDTDTNACIVGGMLGALWGEQGIPIEWKKKVLFSKADRPTWLHPGTIMQIF